MKPKKEKTKQLRASCYKRVSSDEQVKHYSLSFQEEAIKEAVERDCNVADEKHIYTDDGYTGINGNRPGLRAMIGAARRGEIDIIYVWKIDRLYRNTKLILELIDELEEFGVKVKSVTEPYDTSTRLGRYFLTMLAAGAEMEHGNINERTYEGKVRAMRDGKWLGGTPPYGYSLVESRLQINEEEAKWVRKFFRWFVNERLTLYKLQQRVNSIGIPTKHANLNRKIEGGRKTSNTFWNKRTLGRIVGNETYTGEFYYRKFQNPGRAHQSDKLRPPEEWIKISVPAIISAELFVDAQKQLRVNKDNSPKKTKRLYMFAKKLICGVCGHKMSAGFRHPTKGSNQNGTKSYRGAWVSRHGTNQRCENCYFFAEPRLDREIWNAVKELLSDPTTAIERIESHVLNGKSYDGIKEEIEKLDEQEKATEARKQRAFRAYTDEYTDYHSFQGVVVECDKLVEVIKQRRSELSQSLLSDDEKTERIASAKELYSKMKKILDIATYEVRCKVIDIFVENITLKGSDARIELHLPYKGYIPQLMPNFREMAVVGSRELLWDTSRMARVKEYLRSQHQY